MPRIRPATATTHAHIEITKPLIARELARIGRGAGGGDFSSSESIGDGGGRC